MNKKQQFTILMVILVITTMYPIFHLFTLFFSIRVSWFLGLISFWIIWGIISLKIAREEIIQLLQNRNLDWKTGILILIPIIVSFIQRIDPSTSYPKPTIWFWLMYITTAIGNGIFEEIVFRGLFYTQFKDNTLGYISLSSIGFAIWHFAPGSLVTDNAFQLVIAAFFLGVLLSTIMKLSNSLFWPIITHITIGLIAVL
ncbi:MAG: CPBP family intramembrane metalloprotease [Candidatus Heimdallarchaeota archaeon]|nr:CPBP family intramembrane metalloprotease [Candidatus Heimdallarchaeota archaeon]